MGATIRATGLAESGPHGRLVPYYLLTVVVIACGGIPKGYDEGGYSSSVSLKSFKEDFDLVASHWKGNATGLANRTANITSFGVLGAACGCVIALLLDSLRWGRLASWRAYAAVWASGLFIQIFSSGIYGLLLFGRIWGGLGAGALTVVTPIYLSEVTPARSRGWIVSLYMVFLLSFLSLGFFISYAASKMMSDTREQYRLVQSIPLIPMGVAFVCSFWLCETPRWLIARNRVQDARQVLARLTGLSTDDPLLLSNFDSLHQQILESEIDRQERSTKDLFREILSRRYRGRFLLALAMQTFAQWSGGNGITYYIPTIFQYAGITGDSVSLVASGAYGIMKLLASTLTAFFLVDRMGRRPLFITGLALQTLTHVYMAVYMGEQPGSGQNHAASNAAIASVFIYAFGWSIGLCILQSIYATEIFPTRLRGLCYAMTMALHWFFQFAVVRVTPNMLVSLHVWGAYVFWAAICGTGLVVLGLWAPETKRVPLERMDELFQGPWYKTWKARATREAADGSLEVVAVHDTPEKVSQGVEMQHVEGSHVDLEKR
ncbi:hypothetical protein PV08_06348 [Exophiala spinifera]|uniref:Major facilitator superfamily (MFS) profile domain-containing protein n=1 Tax=Exophiala spinifera TaxID=91928 RepID=A0A0D1ZU23_9EURO|nr:uncharacterized protein PV08_06348 [Exophiala spinifera]KIW16297.1 hypothetical protein PV08_06348 [Exophiala spinifera]